MIGKLNEHYSFTNPATVHDEEALTTLELVGRTTAKINEVVDAQNTLRSDTDIHMATQDEKLVEIRDVTMPSDVKAEFKRNLNNGTFEGLVDEYAGELTDRLNNLLGSVVEGSTTLDAELIDLRVGADGRTYENAGDSIRTNLQAKVDMDYLFGLFHNMFPQRELVYEYGGVYTYAGMTSDVFNLPDGNYYMRVLCNKPLKKVMVQNQGSIRMLDINNPNDSFYTFSVNGNGDSLTFHGYCSLATAGEAGTYIAKVYIFKEDEIPKIKQNMIDELSVFNLKELGCELIAHSDSFNNTAKGNTYESFNWMTITLGAGDYVLNVEDSNYVNVMAYLRTNTSVRLFSRQGNPVHGEYHFTVPEEYNNFDVCIAFNTSLATPPTVTDFYANNISLIKGEPKFPEWVFGGTNLSKILSHIDVKEKACVKETGTLASNTKMVMDEFPSFLKKNVGVSFRASIDSFSGLSIGHGGVGVYSGYWFDIDTSNITLKTYYTKEETVKTIAHGLTFDGFIMVVLSYDGSAGKLTIVTKGGSFTHEFSSNYVPCGALFVNGSQEMIDVKFTATCADLHKDLWMIGDSYFGATPERVFGQLVRLGFNNYLLIAQPGLGSGGAFSDLEKALNYATPKYIVWYLGMNDGATSDTYASYMTQLKNICEDKGITLIINKVPTVPSISKEAIGSVVESSGLRFIDSYGCVGASSTGWYEGMLSGDGVHPTEKGAKVLACQMLLDVPEIMSYGKEN